MIQVCQLNGEKYWVNPHLIETIRMNPDVTLHMISGATMVIRDTPEEITTRIIEYRQRIGGFRNEV
jgi:flagellar protein FlbD